MNLRLKFRFVLNLKADKLLVSFCVNASAFVTDISVSLPIHTQIPFFTCAKRRGRMVVTPASNSQGPGFTFRSEDQKS
jgi:hypothetical protein